MLKVSQSESVGILGHLEPLSPLLKFHTVFPTPEGFIGCYGVTTPYLFAIWIPGMDIWVFFRSNCPSSTGLFLGLIYETWLVFLTLYKAVERSRSGVNVDGLHLKVDLLTVLIRDK